jgi:hypothetical protein
LFHSCILYRPDLKTGHEPLLFSGLLVLTAALQLYSISKNGAKKNPAEDFQRDGENKKVYIRNYNMSV